MSGVWQTDGITPLYAACLNGHVEVVRVLVATGAAVNQARVRDDWGGCLYSVLRGLLALGSSVRVFLCACAYFRLVHGLGDYGSHVAHGTVLGPLMLCRTC